jgi:hypothetical protein
MLIPENSVKINSIVYDDNKIKINYLVEMRKDKSAFDFKI